MLCYLLWVLLHQHGGHRIVKPNGHYVVIHQDDIVNTVTPMDTVTSASMVDAITSTQWVALLSLPAYLAASCQPY